MTEIKTVVRVIGLVSAGLLAIGCSSGGGGTGTGGRGGSTGGTGGTGNRGGSTGGTTGTGGTGGTGGSGGVLGCQTSVAPAAPLIADFGADAGLGGGIMGGISVYGGAAGPMYSTATGALVITENQAAMATAQYVGLVLYLNGDSAGTMCIDAHTYTGIQFSLAGTVTGCTVQYSAGDAAHAATGTGDMKAGGPPGSYAPQITLTAAQITAGGTNIMIPFTGAGSPPATSGMPPTAIDPGRLVGVQWQFTIPAAAVSDAGAPEGGAGDGGTGPSCSASLTIDNVMFY